MLYESLYFLNQYCAFFKIYIFLKFLPQIWLEGCAFSFAAWKTQQTTSMEHTPYGVRFLSNIVIHCYHIVDFSKLWDVTSVFTSQLMRVLLSLSTRAKMALSQHLLTSHNNIIELSLVKSMGLRISRSDFKLWLCHLLARSVSSYLVSMSFRVPIYTIGTKTKIISTVLSI